MQADDRARTRERRTAWFITIVMVAAVLYFASQGGIVQDLIEEQQEAPAQFEDLSGITRRGVVLPLDFPAYETERMERTADALRDDAVNWVVVRFPVWTPTPRNIEYSSFALRRTADAIRLLKAQGLGVSLAPVYWDGRTLASMPSVFPVRAFFRGYREMLLDMADAATRGGADALLLDGLFGFRGISAASWLQVIEDLRAHFPRAIEARADTAETPLLYLRHLDAAHVPPDTARVAAVSADESDVRVLYLQRSHDRYGSGLEPWEPVLIETADILQESTELVEDEENDARTDGFTLTGMQAYEQLLMDESPLTRQLRMRRQRGLVRELNQRQQQLVPDTSMVEFP